MSTKLFSLKVAAARPVSERGLAVSFDTQSCDEMFMRFHAGQYIALEADINGQAVRRCYSLASSPLSGRLEVGIRLLDDGKFSHWASENIKPGVEVRALAPEGRFLLPEQAGERDNLLFVACGSGITPVLSMIDQVLAESGQGRVTLIYGNSSIASMMFREEILFLKNRYSDRLQTIFMFSRQEQDNELFSGRVGSETLAALARAGLVNFDGFDHCYVCGPRPVVEQFEAFALEAGIKPDRIHHELFLAAGDSAPAQAPDVVRPDTLATDAKARIKVDGRWFPVVLSGQDSILDQAMEQGVDLPYSCLAGVCSSCRARLIKGRVTMNVCDALDENDKQQGYILTCQSRPLTDEIEIDYDQ
ncbi:MAG: 2Fe-2S iron-sulfur cluster binding domain-containing protein [Gammaproteobacteria bacterium]|nr:2Fe-2S iron-sulfur cluster binding domain-containing protein [Gammaproteobacteria bacterium]